jgi:hypothetical protein
MTKRLIFLLTLIFSLPFCDTLQAQNGLIAHYKLDGTARDTSGNGHHGFVRGSPTTVPDRNGNPNSAYYFDGQNDHLAIPYHVDLQPTDAVTLSLWAHNEDWTKLIPFSGLAGCTESGGYSLYIYEGSSSSDIWGYVRRGGSYANTKYWLANLDTGWHHFAVTYNKNNFGQSISTLYIDGIKEKTNNLASVNPIEYKYQNAFIIGAEAGPTSLPEGDYYKGAIDEVMIFDRVLSDQEIMMLFGGSSDLFFAGGDSESLTVFPNPGNGILSIELKGSENFRPAVLSVIDAMGRQVYLEPYLNLDQANSIDKLKKGCLLESLLSNFNPQIKDIETQ